MVLQYRKLPGLVDIYEEKPQITVQQLRQIIAWWVGQNNNPNTSGTTTAVTLLGKYPAMMTTAQDSSRSEIMWIEAGTEFTILGRSLDQNACIHLASQLVSQAL